MGGPYSKDYSILGSILGSPYLGKLPAQEALSGDSASTQTRGCGGGKLSSGIRQEHPLGFIGMLCVCVSIYMYTLNWDNEIENRNDC